MNETTPTQTKNFFQDKEPLRKILAEFNKQTGFVKDPTATPIKAQEGMIESGIRPEDNIFSCGIIAARDEK